MLGDILKIAAGVALGSSSANRELKQQTQLMQEQERRESNRRDRERGRNNYMRDQIIKENQVRRRNGQPELPVPPGDYSQW